MTIPQSFIDEVLSRVDVIDVIQPRITLKKTGKANYTGLCPFHQEKSPSFSVSQTKQFYHCFGCKVSGNAIGFLMAYEKLTFLEALEKLAAETGMTLPTSQPSVGTQEPKLHFSLLEQCTRYYQQQLISHPVALKYLQQRGFSDHIIQQFKLGFAPAGWHNLKKAVSPSVESEQLLLEVGMLGKKQQQEAFDRFRDRIMFPIRNRRGQTIAFGGRSLDTTLPKYLNSPETSIFHKSRELYGLHEALTANNDLKRVIVVEGYLDVIALHQYGFTETVATLGTAVSLNHIQTLLRYTKTLIFCFDGDTAGTKAAWRALEITLPLMHGGIDILFLFLPNGEDPDSFVHKLGPEAFKLALQQTIPLVDYFFQNLTSELDLQSLAGKTQLVHKVAHYLQKQPKGIFQELMYERLATEVGLRLEKIAEILNKPMENTKAPALLPKSSEVLTIPIRTALSLLLQAPTLLANIKFDENLDELDLPGSATLLRVLTVIKANSVATTGALFEYLKADPERDLLLDLAAQDLLMPIEAWQEELQGALYRIIEIQAERHIQALLTKGKQQGLSLDEKKLLQNLLISKKQL